MFEVDFNEVVKRKELYEVSNDAVKIAQGFYESLRSELIEELTKIDRRIANLEEKQMSANMNSYAIPPKVQKLQKPPSISRIRQKKH